MLRKMVTSLCFALVLCLTMVANVNTASADGACPNLKALEGDYEVIRAGKIEWMDDEWFAPFAGDIGAIVRFVFVPSEQSYSGQPEMYGKIIKAVPGGHPASDDMSNVVDAIMTMGPVGKWFNDEYFPGAYQADVHFNTPTGGSGSMGCYYYVRDNGLLFFGSHVETTPSFRYFKDDILELKRIN